MTCEATRPTFDSSREGAISTAELHIKLVETSGRRETTKGVLVLGDDADRFILNIDVFEDIIVWDVRFWSVRFTN